MYVCMFLYMYVCMFLLSKAEVMYVCTVCVDSLSRGDELHAAGKEEKEGEDDDVIQSTLAITIHTYIHTRVFHAYSFHPWSGLPTFTTT